MAPNIQRQASGYFTNWTPFRQLPSWCSWASGGRLCRALSLAVTQPGTPLPGWPRASVCLTGHDLDITTATGKRGGNTACKPRASPFLFSRQRERGHAVPWLPTNPQANIDNVFLMISPILPNPLVLPGLSYKIPLSGKIFHIWVLFSLLGMNDHSFLPVHVASGAVVSGWYAFTPMASCARTLLHGHWMC